MFIVLFRLAGHTLSQNAAEERNRGMRQHRYFYFFFRRTRHKRSSQYNELAISDVGQVMIATVREEAATHSAQCKAQTPAGKR